MSAERIAVIGLGYVGLPVAVGMARAHGDVVGFDIDARPDRGAARRARTRPASSGARSSPGSTCTTPPTAADLAGLHLLHRHRADADRRATGSPT